MRSFLLGVVFLTIGAVPASGQGETEDIQRRGQALRAQAKAAWEKGDRARAAEWMAEAADLLQKAGSEREEAVARLGAGFYAQETGDGPKALEQYRRSRELWRKLGKPEMEIQVLEAEAALQFRLRDLPASQALFEELRAKSQGAGDGAREAWALFHLAHIHLARGQRGRALETYRAALPLARRHSLSRIEASTLNELATLEREEGSLALALEHLEAAVEVAKSGDDRGLLATVLGNLGCTLSDLGRQDLALARLAEAADIDGAPGREVELASRWAAMGIAHARLLEHDEAVALQERALEVVRRKGLRREEGIALQNLAKMIEARGDRESALGKYSEAIEILRAAGDEVSLSGALVNEAQDLRKLGRLEPALTACREAAAIRERLRLEGPLADALLEQGHIRLAQGAAGEADQDFTKALEIARRRTDREGIVLALDNFAASAVASGDPERGEKVLLEALELAPEHAVTLGNLGRLHVAMGRWREGLGECWEASRLVEAILRRQEGVWAERFLSHEALHLEFYAAVALQALEDGRTGTIEHGSRRIELADLAIQFLEMLRGRRLLARTLRVQSALEAGVDPALLARLEGGAEEARRLDREIRRAADPEAGAALRRSKHDLDEEIASLRAGIRSALGPAGSIRYPEPPELQHVQNVLADDEAVLVYFLPGPASPAPEEIPTTAETRVAVDRAHALVLTRTSARAYRLDGGQRIDLATLRGRLDAFRRTLLASGQGLPATAFSEAAQGLYQILLSEALSGLRTVRRLIVVPDGELHRVPLEALVARAEGESYAALPYVGREFEIVYSPSLASLVEVRRGERPRGEGIVSFAAPERPDLPAIPGTLEEASRTAELFPEGDRRILSGEAALESRARGSTPRRVRLLHFGCHGEIDPVWPLRSYLALAAGEGEDGRLTAGEILGMRFDADLVLLSACRTGEGAILRGEGPASLARFFQVAGAPSTLVSLWAVDDRATRDLVVAFCREWISGGRTRAEALRRARTVLLEKGDKAAPFYWAGFVLMGDGD